MTRRSLVLILSLTTVAAFVSAQTTAPLGPVVTRQTQHLTVIAAPSNEAVAAGKPLSLIFDITPARNMHIYAPGKHTYRVVGISIVSQPWLRAHPTIYPKSEIYHFKPLDERVAVYQKPFRLVRDVTILSTTTAQKVLAGQTGVTISARLEYQACDDTLCYSPQTVPLQWKLKLMPSR